MASAQRRTWSYPQGSLAGVPEHGGHADAARWLSPIFGKTVSRQYVYMTWKRRAVTGFPELHQISVPGGQPLEVFRRAEIEAWGRARVLPAA